MKEDNSCDRIQACPTNPDFWLLIKTEQEQKYLKNVPSDCKSCTMKPINKIIIYLIDPMLQKLL